MILLVFSQFRNLFVTWVIKSNYSVQNRVILSMNKKLFHYPINISFRTRVIQNPKLFRSFPNHVN